MFRLMFSVVLLVVLGACATPPKYEAKNVDSPMPDELMPAAAYVGQWEIKKCINAKQAEIVEFKSQAQGLKLKRWQWRQDLIPLLEVDVKEGKQNVVTYQSKDMHDHNPVINHSTWTWSDNRVVGSFQWQPDKGDQRGNWTGVAMAQFYIKKDQPDTLYWNRWGSSHSSDQGLSQWKSSCVYSRAPGPKVVRIPETQEEVMEKALMQSKLHDSKKTDHVKARYKELGPDESSERDLQFLRKSKSRRLKSDELIELDSLQEI